MANWAAANGSRLSEKVLQQSDQIQTVQKNVSDGTQLSSEAAMAIH
jgi:hypothetical protein